MRGCGNIMKKIISSLLIIIMLMSLIAFSGCSQNVTEAENKLKVYFSALSGFNTNAMKDCVEGDDEDDIGFSTENISDSYIQTENYKKSVEDMYRALAKTFEFVIDSSEEKDDGRVEFDITMKHANVDETAMTEYTNGKVDAYVLKHPSFYDLNEIEQNDKAISVIADAYKQYLQITKRSEKKITITVSKEDGEWKINTDDNKAFFDFLADLFG